MEEVYRKICMLGDPAVGKTSLVRRYVLDVFTDDYIPSIGMKVTKKQILLNKGSMALTLMIWDILGSKTDRFDSIYYKGVKGALIVCDVTRKKTFDGIPRWMSGLFDITEEIPVIILANKIDLDWEIQDIEQNLKEYIRNYNVQILFTSAKTGENVENAFLSLAEGLLLQKKEKVNLDLEEMKKDEKTEEEGGRTWQKRPREVKAKT